MKQFKMHTTLLFYDSFREFMEDEHIGAGDFILTNEFLYDEFVKPLAPACGAIFIEAYGKGEPTTAMVDAIRADLPADVKRIIAVGGGSVLDIAKMLSLHVSSGKAEDLFLGSEAPTRIYDVYAIPTTCGTGSEVTNACAVELLSLHTKRGLNNDLMFPVKSVLIPELIAGLPYKFFATSSIDALIHAVESYMSPKATPHSLLFSKEAIRMILAGYQYIVKNGLEKWTDLASDFIIASNFAGLAFCSAGCAAVHALSYPLGGGYHIPHGEANQLVFAATFRKYKEKKPVGQINELEALFGECLGVPAEEALEAAFTLFDQVQPRKPLRAFGISDSEFQGFAEGVEAGQQHLAVVRDLPLQRLHEIRTCKGTTTRPVVRAPGSARAPPGGETGEGACAGRLMPKGPSDSGIPPYPGGAWREAREAPGGAEFKEALTLGVGHILARGQHWLKRQRPSLGAPAGRRDLLTHSCGGSPALVAEGFGLRTSSSYPVFSSSLFS